MNIKTILLLIILSASLTSCTAATKNLSTKSFVKYEYSLTQIMCDDGTEECLRQLASGEASGAVVGHTPTGAYVLTANHICAVAPTEKTREMAAEALETHVENILSLVEVTDMDYKTYTDVEISATNSKDDLCLLHVPGLKQPALKATESSVSTGSQVLGLAAPEGIFFESMVPIFLGTYSGSDVNRALYTMPAAMGSSGGPILNQDGELIGIVSKIHRTFRNVVLSPVASKVKLFLDDKL